MPQKQIRTRASSVRAHVHKHVKLAVVPHKGNQYRPHAVRRYGIAAILIVVVAAQGIYNNAISGNVLGVQAQITPSGLLTATNQARAAQHEQPLALNEELSRAAKLKVDDMFADQYWDHTSPHGTTPWHWFGEVGYSYAEAGENLAKNFTTSGSAVAAWLASSSHRANVLKASYRDVGFAIKEGELDGQPATLIVALYGAPVTAAVQGVATHSSPLDEQLSFVARLGLGLQALTPVAIGSLVVLLFAINVAMAAHVYRRKLPLRFRRSWYRHHGIYKAVGFTAFAIIIVFAYGSSGQI